MESPDTPGWFTLLYRTALARRHYEHFRLAWQRQSTPDFDDIFESAAS
jgi:hypothetical protein